jgi:hypothetical protein
MLIFLFLQILAAHFDELHAGRLKHAFSSVSVLAIATALPYRENHRLLMISPYRFIRLRGFVRASRTAVLAANQLPSLSA